MRTLLTTTALVALFSVGAVAQEASTAGTENLLERGYQLVDTDGLASRLMGFPIYNAATDDADRLGEINDLVIGESGEVSAVIIGVGGFLGIGEKNVAVSYDDLEWTIASDNTERLVLQTNRESLEAAAEVEMIDDAPNDMAVSDGQMAVDEPMDDTNMAVAPTDDTMTDDAMDGDAMQTAEQPAIEPIDDVETGAVQTDATVNDNMMFDPNTVSDFDETTLTADELLGTNVYGPENEHIGTIGDFVLAEDGNVDAIIIDFGGFLGIGVKEVAVGFDDLSFYTDEMNNRSLLINVTREQMEQATAFNRDTYETERDAQRMQVSAL